MKVRMYRSHVAHQAKPLDKNAPGQPEDNEEDHVDKGEVDEGNEEAGEEPDDDEEPNTVDARQAEDEVRPRAWQPQFRI